MIKEIQLTVSPEIAGEDTLLRKEISGKLSVAQSDISGYRIIKKSLDARHDVKINLTLTVFLGEIPTNEIFTPNYRFVGNKEPVIVVGAGPAGLFAALQLIESGFRPVITERGKDVSSRKKDIARISTAGIIDAESNYCFGEGGAGTFSDGKLYTRSNKRGNIRHVFQVLHFHGANQAIMYEAHPHIGTDMLPEIIKKIRQTILDCGGEILFNTRIDDIIIADGKINAVKTSSGDILSGKAVVLATGHSARDVYHMLHRRNILLESKSFAMGVRVEHPQALIDSIQYHTRVRNPYLPAASYSLAVQSGERGVYSFCMCPGGYIVPSATAADEIVVNGMSSSRRHTAFANSGIVVEIRAEDFSDYQKHGSLAGLYYQKDLEILARKHGSSDQSAPAQRLSDFIRGQESSSLPQSSYIPGIHSSPLHQWLPENIRKRLQDGFTQFDKKMHGFVTNEAYIAGVESRTSSPVRIPRLSENMQHPEVKGLFPCGEGSGYAGGIVSSAMDGENAALEVCKYLMGKGQSI